MTVNNIEDIVTSINYSFNIADDDDKSEEDCTNIVSKARNINIIAGSILTGYKNDENTHLLPALLRLLRPR